MTNGQSPQEGPRLSRRRFVQLGYGGAVAVVAGTVGIRELTRPDAVRPTSLAVRAVEKRRPATGHVVRRTLVARADEVDLGGRTVRTWSYDGSTPAAPIRVTAGDTLQVSLRNQLPEATTVHWHGLALRNDMDGVPGLTMDPVPSGSRFDYSFVVPDPGTYWFHPHVGVQLDTGLQGALIVEDPSEPGDYDTEAVLILDDWTDGWSASPNEILRGFKSKGMPAMQGMDMSGMNPTKTMDPRQPLGEDAGDVTYPAHLINGRLPQDPHVVESKAGNKVRLRIINAGSDTAYRFLVGNHRLTVTHTDGYPVQPVDVDSLVLGMGERYDVVVTVQDGQFPIFAVPVGKKGAAARAVLRTRPGTLSDAVPPSAGHGRLLTYTDLVAATDVRLPRRAPDKTLDVELSMGDGGRKWLINRATYDDFEALQVQQNERVRLNFVNKSMMFHPMHLHGHTFELARKSIDGPRKDTINVLPMSKLSVDLHTDNPGQWLLHCHNAYHGELGMMTVLSYVQ